MMETINERIKLLIPALGFNSLDSFDKALGKSRSTTTNITGPKKQKPGFDYLETIKKIFPKVDLNWLITGEGEPFSPDSERKEYTKSLEQKVEALERANRRYETMIDMAVERQEHRIAANFQLLSKNIQPVRPVYNLYEELKKTA